MGVIVIVGTGGKAIPFKLAGLIFGGYGIVSGGSDIIEGGHNMWLGSRDDVTTYAVNPLLDTVFGGNRALYQKVNMFADLGSIFMIGTAHMMPDQQQRVVVLPENNTRVLSNGRVMRSSSSFTGF